MTNNATRAIDSATWPGDILKLISACEPRSTTSQKTLTIDLACDSPPGITTLSSRRSSNQGAGSSQRDLAAGPVGPLNGPLWRSPQRPLNTSQASGSLVSSTLSGSTTTSGTTRSEGPVVVSHPNPSLAPRPR